jgi:phosphatidylglycerophosphatase A
VVIKNNKELREYKTQNKSLLDYISLGIATVGVGYIPLAPGTWGSGVGILIYLIVRQFESEISSGFIQKDFQITTVYAWVFVINGVLLFLLCLIGIWSATRATRLFKTKDPQQAVIDEVIGQLITFSFVPFIISGWFILAGFLLFRLFDIWKPYPIDVLQDLPGGLGVCVDDILAGVYAGLCLSLLYAAGVFF